MEWFALVLAGVIGAVFGSFIEACVSRQTNSLADLLRPSSCDSCGKEIPWYRNIPLVAWPLAKGRCFNCRAQIPLRTWLTEVFCTAGCVLVVNSTLSNPAFNLAWFIQTFTLVAIFLTTFTIALWDWKYSRIPNTLVILGLSVIYPTVILQALIFGDWSQTYFAAIGSISYGAILWFVRLAKPGGMGLGDVKLALLLGALAASWSLAHLLVAFFLAFATGAAYGLFLIGTGKAGRQSKIPFGPWMIIGLWLSYAFGSQIWSAYLELIASVV